MRSYVASYYIAIQTHSGLNDYIEASYLLAICIATIHTTMKSNYAPCSHPLDDDDALTRYTEIYLVT